MKIVYISDDGIEFDNRYECEEHESLLQHPHLTDITFFDKDGNKYDVEYFDTIFNDRIYNRAEEIDIPNEDAFKDFAWIADECGWKEFEQITSLGYWRRFPGQHRWDDGVWVKEEDGANVITEKH